MTSFKILTAPDGRRVVLPTALIEAYKGRPDDLALLVEQERQWVAGAHGRDVHEPTIAELATGAIADRAAQDHADGKQRSAWSRQAAMSKVHPWRDQCIAVGRALRAKRPSLSDRRTADLILDQLTGDGYDNLPSSQTVRKWLKKS